MEEKQNKQKTAQHLDDTIVGMQKNMAYKQLQLALQQTEFARQDQIAAAEMENRGRLSEARGIDLQRQAHDWANETWQTMKDAETHCVTSRGASESFQVGSRLVPLLLGISMFPGCLY